MIAERRLAFGDHSQGWVRRSAAKFPVYCPLMMIGSAIQHGHKFANPMLPRQHGTQFHGDIVAFHTDPSSAFASVPSGERISATAPAVIQRPLFQIAFIPTSIVWRSID